MRSQVMHGHFHEFGKEQMAHFVEFLPQAMTSLSQQKWLVWHDVLELAGVSAAATIINDVSHDPDVPDQLPMLRSHRRIEALCQDLDIDLAVLTR